MNKRLRAIFIFGCLFSFLLSEHLPLTAQPSGAEFLKIGAGGRGLALGGAYVALTDDETSALWNPAGIANIKGIQGYLSYVSMFNQLAAYNFAAASMQFGPNLAAALSIVRLSVDGIPRYGPLQGSRFDRLTNRSLQSTGEPEGFFNSADNAILFTVGKGWDLEILLSRGLAPYTIPVRVTVGASMKFVQRNLDKANASAQGMDFGAIVELQSLGENGARQRSLAFGVSVFDLASSKLNWSTGSDYSDNLPMRIVLGVALKQTLQAINGEVNFTIDGNANSLNRFRVGGEYVHQRFLALRGGWRLEGWSMGAGMYFGNFVLDYSFATHDLGTSHRIGGGIRF